MTTYSRELIKEYQQELYIQFGIAIDDESAQTDLGSLVRSMFSTDIAGMSTERREFDARKEDVKESACIDSLSAKISAVGENKVGASITPTLGHRDKNNYGR